MNEEVIFLSDNDFDSLILAARRIGICRSILASKLIAQIVQNLSTDEIRQASEDISPLIIDKTPKKKITHKDVMLELLRQHPQAGVSSGTAKDKGITQPATVVHLLKEDGYDIECSWAYSNKRRKQKNNYKIYTLLQEPSRSNHE